VKEIRNAHTGPVIAVALVSPTMAAAAAAAAVTTANAGGGGDIDSRTVGLGGGGGSVGGCVGGSGGGGGGSSGGVGGSGRGGFGGFGGFGAAAAAAGGGIGSGRLGGGGLPGGNPPVEALSASLSGAVSRHTLTSLGPIMRVKASCLGERTAVIQFQPLPLLAAARPHPSFQNGQMSRASSAQDVSAAAAAATATTAVFAAATAAAAAAAAVDASGVVALVTSAAILVMRLHPNAEVLAKVPRPTAPASLPCVAWAPRVISSDSSEELQWTRMVGTHG